MTVEMLLSLLREAWSAETSAYNKWTPANPSAGQCAVTALVVQDYLGGDLVRVANEQVSHYYNRLPDGAEVDLTREQFTTWNPTPAEVRTRDYVLSFEPTRLRYEQLKERLTANTRGVR